ncbi:hypothetical protein PSTT_00595 [Puccinia striiformis]|uniref:CTD kinase subunit gamma Ctk3 C-terminal domain-containing protein n=1 Tax=Puccinia striiformis TaxID=27350 RepID=A0A2S4W6H5_9BASI|nr:hypothetical protein PSTT_00595 [Puccinia striiformis]
MKLEIANLDYRSFLNLGALEQIDQILNHRKQMYHYLFLSFIQKNTSQNCLRIFFFWGFVCFSLGKMEVNDTQVGIEDNELLDFTKKEILDRIDDDRERHKRLRERIWVLPIPSMSSLSPKLTNIQHPQRRIHIIDQRHCCILHYNRLRIQRDLRLRSLRVVQLGRPHIELDLTISLECDQLINANLEDTGSAGLEDHDWNAIHFDNHRCFGLASNHHRLLDQFVDF